MRPEKVYKFSDLNHYDTKIMNGILNQTFCCDEVISGFCDRIGRCDRNLQYRLLIYYHLGYQLMTYELL